MPLDNAVPPLEVAYQSIVSPDPAEALNVTVPVPHRVTFVAVGIDASEFTIALSAFLIAETQPVVVFLASA